MRESRKLRALAKVRVESTETSVIEIVPMPRSVAVRRSRHRSGTHPTGHSKNSCCILRSELPQRPGRHLHLNEPLQWLPLRAPFQIIAHISIGLSAQSDSVESIVGVVGYFS